MIPLHVLFVDDEPDIRAVIELSLGLDPVFVGRGCSSGPEALATAAEWRPDLILLDVVMPGMGGGATLARLREDRRTSAIRVVFMSAMSARAHMREFRRFLALGAAGVIAKPFDPITLPSILRRYMPTESRLAPVRETFFRRLSADAAELAACRTHLAQRHSLAATLNRIRDIAHALAGVCGIYGFAGISSESAALEKTAIGVLAGDGAPSALEPVLDRLLARMAPR